MSEQSQINKNDDPVYGESIWPIRWIWHDKNGKSLTLKDWLISRKFTFFYILTIWTIVALIGFGSTRNCEKTWQLAFQCEQAMWMIKLYTEPLGYFVSMFTAPWFHNGLDHILFVTVIGFIVIIQSFEVQKGAIQTITVFFITYILMGIIMAAFFNYGIDHWPESSFFQYAFKRNAMGGSAGMYGVLGAHAYYNRRPWVIIAYAFLFESFNHFFLGIRLHISITHIVSLFSGITICWLWISIQRLRFTQSISN